MYSTIFSGRIRVRRVRFRSADERFAILEADADGSRVMLRLRDIPLAVEADDVLDVSGRWQTHPTHGRQLVVRCARPATPQGRRASLSFLCSIDGIGPGRAEKLMALLGADLFAAVDADPEGCFLALPGVGAKTALRAAESWRARRGLRELHLLLAEHGLTRLAARLDKHYGGAGRAEAAIRADPYRLTELHGVGFITADKIAHSAGVDPSSPRRAHAAIIHLLSEAEGDGHSFLPWSGRGGQRHGPGRAAHADLPPGRAVDDHPGSPRDQRRPPARLPRPVGDAARRVLHHTQRPGSRRGRDRRARRPPPARLLRRRPAARHSGALADLQGTEPGAGELVLDVDGDRVPVPYDRAASLVHAYAISVHKSQGSEIPVVVMPVHRSHAILLTRNLLYTAVSRASRALVLVG